MLFLLFGATIIFAQQKPASKPDAKAVNTTQSQPANSDEKDALLIKAWKLTSIEVFGTINKPNEKQKSDGVTFMADGLAFLTMEGVVKTGKWSFPKPKTYVTIEIDDTKEKFRFKVITLTKDQLLYEYQDAELIRTKYTCEPLKK
jgi:hypothetical protein